MPNLECNAILVSSGGDSIISGWSDGRVRAFLPETGKLKFVINDAHTKLPNDKDNNGCTALAIVPNERPSGSYVLMTGGGDGRVRAWRVTSSHQAMLFSIKDHRKPVTAIKVAQMGRRRIRPRMEGLCFELDPAPGAPPLKRFSYWSRTSFVMSLAPDGTGCLTAGSNFKLTYWDGWMERTCGADGSHGLDDHIDVDPEHGAYYVTGSGDSTVKVCPTTRAWLPAARAWPTRLNAGAHLAGPKCRQCRRRRGRGRLVFGRGEARRRARTEVSLPPGGGKPPFKFGTSLRHRRASPRPPGRFSGTSAHRSRPAHDRRPRPCQEPPVREGGHPARTQSACKLGGAAPARGSFVVAARHETASLLL